MAKIEIKQSSEMREALVSEMIESEALINILERKGIITKQELVQEMKKLRAELLKAKH
ncbi:MAG: hypothetical protein PHG91_01975 [Syntrophales bacterium]|jgi:hypothetical protein|nr:hypothetical protein [Syntrophales bacterium]MDD5232139.1 hypothetical protein [Syntrophales bacterium]MDD5532165.1 hypothetical protein [Syntrophales bacterium]HPL62925.1 hypothetical protein [Syntrophales bacterium]